MSIDNDMYIKEDNTIDSFDIQKHPTHYLHQLLKGDDVSRCKSIFYQYGPYLIMNHANIDLCKKEVKYNRDYPLRFIIDISDVIKILHSNFDFKTIKSKLLEKIPECVANDEYNKTYASFMVQFIQNTIKNIRDYQYENYLLESAILNTSPIVPYEKLLYKPALSKLVSNENSAIFSIDEEKQLDSIFKHLTQSKKEIINKLDAMLIWYIMDIINENHAFIDTHNYSNQYRIENEGDISSDLFELFKSKKILNPCNQYYLLAYLVFNFKPSSYQSLYKLLTKMKYSYNELIDTKNTPLSEVLESFSVLAPPSIINLNFMKHKSLK